MDKRENALTCDWVDLEEVVLVISGDSVTQTLIQVKVQIEGSNL